VRDLGKLFTIYTIMKSLLKYKATPEQIKAIAEHEIQRKKLVAEVQKEWELKQKSGEYLKNGKRK
jgi:hypothetical protein